MPAISAPFGVPSVDSTFIVPTVDAVFAPLAADPATQFVVPEPADPPESAAPGADSDDRVKRLLDTLRQNDEEPPLSAPVRKEPGDGPLKVQVHINRPPIVVNEHLKGADPEEIVSKIKARVLPELGFGARLVIGTMSDLRFAQEIVKRYNDREKQKHPIPASCREFLSLAQSLGFITIE
jgi:hypothetical protein